MTPALSPNTKAILLLTAPLIVGRSSSSPDLLRPGEYKRLARHLRDIRQEPADLMAPAPNEILDACKSIVDRNRLQLLLGRGFQLSQAVERWQTRAIWVISRGDEDYPRRLKKRLKEDAPAVLYGCGEASLLEKGGLAVVGSRHVDDALIDYAMNIGRSVAKVGRPVVSGGAKGVDQAGMRGALEAGGRASGVLADGLERQAMNREHRNMLLEGQLALVSPYDPNAGFNAGNAMQRNKLIYALSDAALVVNSDADKGGTWTGAVEQIEKLNLVPVYVRSTGKPSPGLEALRKKGAIAWPDPADGEALEAILNSPAAISPQEKLALFSEGQAGHELEARSASTKTDSSPESTLSTSVADEAATQIHASAAEPTTSPREALWAEARRSITHLANTPVKHKEVAERLGITEQQSKIWLDKLVDEGVLERTGRPARYALKREILL